MTTAEFRHLFTPVEIGPVRLRNRIYMTPHATMFASEGDNLPSERLAYYCAERAKGGAGLIEVSMGAVSSEEGGSSLAASSEGDYGIMHSGQPIVLTGRWPLRASDPSVVPGYARVARMVHEHGAKCFVQLGVGGANFGDEEGVSAFPFPSSLSTYTSPSFTARELSETALEGIAESFGRAADYVKASGLDGVDIQGAHGALIAEFLSGRMNRRKDRYGGSVENRTRFLQEVIKRIREHVGTDIAVGMRLFGDGPDRGGNTLEDTVEITRLLDGKLDWITPDQGIYPQTGDWQSVPMYVESGYNLRISSPIKSALRKTKVGAVGKFTDPYQAESLIASGVADIVALTRALIADPQLPNKAREGKVDRVRPCIGSLQDCWGRMIRGLPISCTVNPVVSREKEWGEGTVSAAAHKKKVLVIGGGPAGLETARIAAMRGHSVVIYEKSRQLGGQALLAGRLPGRENVKAIVTWLEGEVRALGVEVKYGMEVTPDAQVVDYLLEEERPDAVVVATGSSPIRTGFQPYDFREVQGWDQKHVCTDVDVLNGYPVGQRVVIGDTLGFIEAPGVAELLARQGKQVEIITPHEHVAQELKLYDHWEFLLPRLYDAGVKLTHHTWISRIEPESVMTYNVFSPKIRGSAQADTVVLITGKMQNDSLRAAFEGKVREVRVIGDASLGGARIGHAMFDAQRTARAL